METFLGTLFIIVCILLILVVLLQKGRGGGLGAAFGGAGSSAFGTRTGDVFTWVTIVLTALFLLLAIFSTIVHRPERGTITIGGFAPPPGTNIDREITVRVVDVVPRDAEIHYTLDGLDPTEESKRYPKIGVRVKPGQTLKICAYKAGFNPSEVRSAEYPKIEGEVPTTRPEAPATKPATQPVTRPATRPTTQPAAATQPGERPGAPATRPAPPTAPPAKAATKPPATAPAAKKPAPAPAAGP